MDWVCDEEDGKKYNGKKNKSKMNNNIPSSSEIFYCDIVCYVSDISISFGSVPGEIK